MQTQNARRTTKTDGILETIEEMGTEWRED